MCDVSLPVVPAASSATLWRPRLSPSFGAVHCAVRPGCVHAVQAIVDVLGICNGYRWAASVRTEIHHLQNTGMYHNTVFVQILICCIGCDHCLECMCYARTSISTTMVSGDGCIQPALSAMVPLQLTSCQHQAPITILQAFLLIL